MKKFIKNYQSKISNNIHSENIIAISQLKIKYYNLKVIVKY